MYSAAQREEIVDHVCAQVEQKRPLYKVLTEDEGMPNQDTFYRWQAEDETLYDKVARARKRGFEAHLEDMIEIADNATDDAYVEYDKDGEVIGAKINGLAINRAKVMIHAREKAAQMLQPKHFGAKLDLTSGGDKLPAPQTTVLVDNRVQSLIAIANEAKRADAIKQELLGND